MILDLRANVENGRKCSCANCDWSEFGEKSEPISDPEQRLEPGEILPIGQCPSCGALCYLDE